MHSFRRHSRPAPLWAVRAFLLLATLATLRSAGPVTASPDLQSLIRRAGNAESEKERYRLLEELSRQTGLPRDLEADLNSLLPVVDAWANGREKGNPVDPDRAAENGYLAGFFIRRIDPRSDYPPRVAENSPLHPVWCLYRGRMLIWRAIQTGSLARDPVTRDQYHGEGRRLLEKARAAFPENRIIRMYLGERFPWPDEQRVAADPAAPEWANLHRESLHRLHRIIDWWIDNRQLPDGSFGGGWGDDVEMWRWWIPILIAFDDPKVIAAQRRLSEGILSLPRMKEGYTSLMSDVEHTAEDTGDSITPLMFLEPESPRWKSAALRLAELMRDQWTARNERGFLMFRSTWFNVHEMDMDPDRSCDTVYHPRTMLPALIYWQRTGDKTLTSLFSDWMDTWVDAAARAERGKPAGILPSAIHWPDGRVGGTGPNWWEPNNYSTDLYDWPSAMGQMTHTLLLTWHMTGRDKYLEPIRSMARIYRSHRANPPRQAPSPGSEAWCALVGRSGEGMAGFLLPTLEKYRRVTGDRQFDDLLKDAPEAAGSGDLGRVTEDLRQFNQVLESNWPIVTSEMRWTDRVLAFDTNYLRFYSSEPLPRLNYRPYSMATGNVGDAIYFPLNAVRWLTPPQDIAALVTDSKEDRFSARLYHFGDSPRKTAAELYLLKPGNYRMTVSPAEGPEPPLQTSEVALSNRVNRVDFVLPPGREVVVQIERLPGSR